MRLLPTSCCYLIAAIYRNSKFRARIILQSINPQNCLKVSIYVIFFVGLFFVFPKSFGSVYAAQGINHQINFQGKVVKSDGTNVADGSYNFLFCIYTTASPSTACTSGANNDAVWRESKTLTVSGGIFRTSLGDTTTLPGSVNFNTDNLYLGINFNSDGQMMPLVRFASVPQAFNAEQVNGLTVENTSNAPFSSTTILKIADGKTAVFNNGLTFSGADGKTLNIGSNSLTFSTSADTSLTLPTSGTLSTLAGNEVLTNKTIGSTGLIFSGAATDITTATNEDLTLTPAGSGQTVLSSDFDSGVQIGVSSSTHAPLSVSGGIGANAGFILNNINSGDLLAASASGVTKFTIKNDGTASSAAGFTIDGTGNIQSTNAQTLTLGGSTTGDISFKPGNASTPSLYLESGGNVGIGTNTPGTLLQVQGGSLGSVVSRLRNSQVSSNATTIFSMGNDSGNEIAEIILNSSTNSFNGGASSLNIGSSAGPLTFITGAIVGADIRQFISTSGLVGLGTSSPLSELHVTRPLNSQFGATGHALAIFDQIENQDILTASAGGVTKFTIKSDGSASMSGGLVFDSAASLQTTKNQTFTFGGNSTGNLVLSPNNGTGIVTFGTSANGLTFDITNSGPTYNGTARPTKTITLSPEFAGAVLTASGSATTNGVMTSDASPSAAFRTYYYWYSTQTSLQDYTVMVRFTLPADFSDWTSGNTMTISYNNGSNVAATNKLDVYIYKASDASGKPVYFSTGNVSSAKTWTTVNLIKYNLNDGIAPDLSAAGDTAVIYLKLYSSGTYNYTQVGDISINYLAKF